MKKPIAAMLLALFLGGCGKGGGTGEEITVPQGTISGIATQGGSANQTLTPGLQETQRLCTQCHALPNPNQHHPAAWPSIVARMENLMVANKRATPNPMEREAILGYLQGGWQK